MYEHAVLSRSSTSTQTPERADFCNFVRGYKLPQRDRKTEKNRTRPTYTRISYLADHCNDVRLLPRARLSLDGRCTLVRGRFQGRWWRDDGDLFARFAVRDLHKKNKKRRCVPARRASSRTAAVLYPYPSLPFPNTQQQYIWAAVADGQTEHMK